MKTIVVLLWIQVIAVTLEYEFRCPVAGEWRHRPRKLFCGATQYVCLLYLPDKTYQETCDGTDFSIQGSKLVFQPNFNKATCSYDRYQPFPFSTDGSSGCVYKKSFCNAEGQIIFNKGNFENDTRCGCNVSKGYRFVTNPKNRCYCIPMQEDCSCYKPVCKNKDTICPLDVGSIKNSSCLVLPDNENIVSSTEDSLDTRTYVMDNNDRGRTNRFQCIYFTVAALVMITVIGCFADQLTITMKMNGEKVAVDYGTSITLTCTTTVRRNCCVKSIDWYRNGQKIKCCRSNTTKYESDQKVPMLIIKNVGQNDLGNYKCVLETIFFRHTSENIKVVHKMPAAIQNMSREEKTKYMEALNHEEEVRRYVRIQVIGKHGVGKSTLIRRLLGDKIEDVVSTDGIEILKTCQISTRDGTWTTSKAESERKEKMKRRILKMVGMNVTKTEQPIGIAENEEYKNVETKDTLTSQKQISDKLTTSVSVEPGINDKSFDNISVASNSSKQKSDKDETTYTSEINLSEINDTGPENKTSKGTEDSNGRRCEHQNPNSLEITNEKTKMDSVVSDHEDKKPDYLEIPNEKSKMDSDVRIHENQNPNPLEIPHENSKMDSVVHDRENINPDSLQIPNEKSKMDSVVRDHENTNPDSLEISNENSKMDGHELQNLDSLEITDEMTKNIIEQMDSILLEVKHGKEEFLIEDAVECGIWDFAGQKEYYVTHQSFLTSNAIYLLVTNVNEDIKPIRDDKDFHLIGEYIDFWFDSIHSFCEDRTAPMLKPPVIMVCTHTDKCKKLEKRKMEYDKQFANISGQDEKFNHKRDIFYISNKQVTGEINQLKSKISELAKEMEYFQVNLPKHWINLENALDFITKILGKNILSWSNIIQLANQNSIQNKEELLTFLNYQHSIGNIIFFENICDYIILQPTWLIKCFRCLVCDDSREKRSSNISTTEWTKLTQTGELSETTIDYLFEKERDLKSEHKQYLLAVMEKFDIIVKPQFVDTIHGALSSSYYIPCMIRDQLTSLVDIKKKFGVNESLTVSPWLILEFNFFPFPHFNHILVSFIREYTVCGHDNEQKAIYGGKAVFFLDNTKVTKFIICYSKNAISLQIWDWGEGSDDLHKRVLEKLLCKIKDLENTVPHIKAYAIAAKCRDGDYFNKDGRIRHEDHKEVFIGKQYFCDEHKSLHDTNQIENTWFKHADIKLEDIIRTYELEKPEVRFLRIFNLLFRVASPIVRMIFNDEINSTQLRKTLHQNRLPMEKRYRKKEKIINDFQWNLLFRSPGVISSEDFDIKLMTQLLESLTHIDISDVYPAQADIRVGAVLSRINFIRNEITKNFDGKLTEYLFNEYWDEIGQAVLQLISFHTRNNQYSAERIPSGRLFALNPLNIDNNKLRNFIDKSERYPAMILEQIISEYCNSTKQSIEDILEHEKHNLYHKRKSFDGCIECESTMLTIDWKRDNMMITDSQWEALYEADERRDRMSMDTHRCYKQIKCIRCCVPKKINAMDFSIAKVLCLCIPNILTLITSRLCGKNFDTFLVQNKHLLYHCMESERCCQCENDPTEKKVINKNDWAKLYKKKNKKSHPEDNKRWCFNRYCCCGYSVRSGIKYKDMDNDILVKIFSISGPIGILNKIEQNAFLNFLQWTVFDLPLQKALIELSKITDKEWLFNEIISSDKTFATEIDARRWISKHVRNQKVTTEQQFAILLHDEDGLNVKSVHIPNTFPLPHKARAFTDITAEENYFLVTVHVLTKIVHPVIKKMFDTTLTDKEKGTHLKQQEYKYLSHKEQKGWKIDLKLMIDILIKTTKDKGIGGQLHVIDNFRTEIVQSSSGIVDEKHFQDIMKVISKAVTHLGGDIYQEKLRSLQVKRNLLGNS